MVFAPQFTLVSRFRYFRKWGNRLHVAAAKALYSVVTGEPTPTLERR